jgi:hypothetical protein
MAQHPITSQKHLRVQTPRTVDGISAQRDEHSSEIIYRVTHHPLSAKRHFERLNASLPKQLKMIIEELPGDSESPRRNKTPKLAGASHIPKQHDTPDANTLHDNIDLNRDHDDSKAASLGEFASKYSEDDRDELSSKSKTELHKEYADTFGGGSGGPAPRPRPRPSSPKPRTGARRGRSR